jgi:hypothetical protein
MARGHDLLDRRISALGRPPRLNFSTLMIDLSRVLRIPNLEEKIQ